MIRKAGALAALTVFATSSFAVPVTMDFGAAGTGSIIDPNGLGNDNTLYRTTIGEHTLTVTGYIDADLGTIGTNVADQFEDREEVTRDIYGPNQGLGIDSDTWSDSNQMDGLHESETMHFAFSGSGTLTQIVFNDWDTNDDFDLAVDGITVFDEQRPLPGVWNGAVAFDAWFVIGADGDNDDFRIRSMTIDFDDPITHAVPAPGTLPLVGLGVVSLFARRRG